MGMQKFRKDAFSAADAAGTNLADGRVASPSAYSASVGIGRALSARLGGYGEGSSGGTAVFQVAVEHADALDGVGGASDSASAQQTLLGEVTFTLGAVASGDKVVPDGSRYAAVTTWSASVAMGSFESVYGEDGTAIVGDILHLACLGRGHRLRLKPKTFTNVTGFTPMAAPSRP